jgi:hypothetical protein
MGWSVFLCLCQWCADAASVGMMMRFEKIQRKCDNRDCVIFGWEGEVTLLMFRELGLVGFSPLDEAETSGEWRTWSLIKLEMKFGL